MCCFSGPVHVAQTRIFARGLGHGRQALVYAMEFEAAADVAMILPLPTPPGSAEDDVGFVDLSEYPDLFEDLQKGFPLPAARSFGAPAPQFLSLLEVKQVGAFEASFVPSPDDFERLDPRFRLPPSLVEAFPTYGDYGFAVFQLRGGAGREKVHPMAFTFPRRDPDALFFPTVHVHDGVAHPEAQFDHQLYCQWPHSLPAPWWKSGQPAERHVDVGRALGLVDGGLPVASLALHGTQPNDDTWVR